MRGIPLKTNNYIDSIQCKINLDNLIMSKDCTPQYLEENLNVGDDILYDAVLLSTCSGWLLKLDVLEQFSSNFRKMLFKTINAFPRIVRSYFANQIKHSHNRELERDYDDVIGQSLITASSMFNPMIMLGNKGMDDDLRVIHNEITLRELFDGKINDMLTTGDKSFVDFTYSIFLLEMLNPKFFSQSSEAEQLVILSNLDKYFEFLAKFRASGFRIRDTKNELNVPQNLVKWILSDEQFCTNRVKFLAWKKMFGELVRAGIGYLNPKFRINQKVFKLCNESKVNDGVVEIVNLLSKSNKKIYDIDEWLTKAEGLYESFELDCTLHGLNATDYLAEILANTQYWKMLDGMVDFQDEKQRVEMLKRISHYMTSFR